MGKNQKHKKEIRSEKSKIKLKTKLTKTKFLPKGANVTDTNFKIKPIIIREQLKTACQDELVTKRKHNLKDLLTRSHHYNTTMRNEACEGLMELLNATPSETIEQSLYIILQSVLKLVLDIETKIRQKAIKVLRLILEKVTSIKVSPFYDILSSYVLCAMTHIDASIQDDSLLLVDVYLECTPELIVKYFDKLFSNFLTLISKLRSDSKLSRTLTVNLSGKLTSIKWRIKVLSRLQGILKIVIESKRVTSPFFSKSCKVVRGNENVYIPLYRTIRSVTKDVVGVSNDLEKNDVDYVQVLLPLLYETWAEAVPLDEIKYRENGAMLINQDSASILSCVIGILYLLIELLQYSDHKNQIRKLFLSKHNKVLNHFLNQYPYRQHGHSKKLEKSINKLLISNTDPKCIQENLLICYVFCILYKTFPSPYHVLKAAELLKDINVYLSHRNYIPPGSINVLILVLRVIYFENLSSWQQENLISGKLLDNLVNFYNNLPASNEYKIDVFGLLVDIAKESHVAGSPKFTVWVKNLPLQLLKPEVNIEFIDTLSLLARQNNQMFLDALSSVLPQLLDILPNLKVTNDDFPPAQIKLLNMLYYVPNLSLRHKEVLQLFLERCKNCSFIEHANLLLLKKS